MTAELQTLRLEHIHAALAALDSVKSLRPPPGGWLRAVREALGRTLRQQADRVGITAPTLHKSERAEAEGRITLGQLRKLAEGLDCELVYGLVPRRPLKDVVEAQAERIARDEVLGVAHSMSLEEQRPSSEFVDRQLAQRRSELLRGKWSALWR
jgi:predicted DNA-binding mobile mystery protein A